MMMCCQSGPGSPLLNLTCMLASCVSHHQSICLTQDKKLSMRRKNNHPAQNASLGLCEKKTVNQQPIRLTLKKFLPSVQKSKRLMSGCTQGAWVGWWAWKAVLTEVRQLKLFQQQLYHLPIHSSSQWAALIFLHLFCVPGVCVCYWWWGSKHPTIILDH